MIVFEDTVKYNLLNQFVKKLSLYRICGLVYSFAFDATWYICDSYGKKFFGWSFLERRQLFFELVAYNLEQKKIKFGGDVEFGLEPFIWNESISIQDTIAYLEKGFCKDEEVFVHGESKIVEVFRNVNITSDTWLREIIEYPIDNFEMNLYSYFFKYCPTLAYWHEESKSWVWSD